VIDMSRQPRADVKQRNQTADGLVFEGDGPHYCQIEDEFRIRIRDVCENLTYTVNGPVTSKATVDEFGFPRRPGDIGVYEIYFTANDFGNALISIFWGGVRGTTGNFIPSASTLVRVQVQAAGSVTVSSHPHDRQRKQPEIPRSNRAAGGRLSLPSQAGERIGVRKTVAVPTVGDFDGSAANVP